MIHIYDNELWIEKPKAFGVALRAYKYMQQIISDILSPVGLNMPVQEVISDCKRKLREK